MSTTSVSGGSCTRWIILFFAVGLGHVQCVRVRVGRTRLLLLLCFFLWGGAGGLFCCFPSLLRPPVPPTHTPPLSCCANFTPRAAAASVWLRHGHWVCVFVLLATDRSAVSHDSPTTTSAVFDGVRPWGQGVQRLCTVGCTATAPLPDLLHVVCPGVYDLPSREAAVQAVRRAVGSASAFRVDDMARFGLISPEWRGFIPVRFPLSPAERSMTFQPHARQHLILFAVAGAVAGPRVSDPPMGSITGCRLEGVSLVSNPADVPSTASPAPMAAAAASHDGPVGTTAEEQGGTRNGCGVCGVGVGGGRNSRGGVRVQAVDRDNTLPLCTPPPCIHPTYA
jgi:hypothetical protein